MHPSFLPLHPNFSRPNIIGAAASLLFKSVRPGGTEQSHPRIALFAWAGVTQEDRGVFRGTERSEALRLGPIHSESQNIDDR